MYRMFRDLIIQILAAVSQRNFTVLLWHYHLNLIYIKFWLNFKFALAQTSRPFIQTALKSTSRLDSTVVKIQIDVKIL